MVEKIKKGWTEASWATKIVISLTVALLLSAGGFFFKGSLLAHQHEAQRPREEKQADENRKDIKQTKDSLSKIRADIAAILALLRGKP